MFVEMLFVLAKKNVIVILEQSQQRCVGQLKQNKKAMKSLSFYFG